MRRVLRPAPLTAFAIVHLVAACGLSLNEYEGVEEPDTDAGDSGQPSSSGQISSSSSGSGSSSGEPQCAEREEICDGIDNNCNGEIDEGCDCLPGDKRACYTGPTETKDKGLCVAGVSTCSDAGKYGPCEGEVVPVEESCNGVDDNCDGQIDETCACVPGTTSACYPGAAGTAGVGACKAGTSTCNPDGTPGPCLGATVPTVELCDGQDHNCNGIPNDIPNLNQDCNTGELGVCRDGKTICQGGAPVCKRNVEPSAEVCDGKDNNCNGQTDESPSDVGGACQSNGVGACRPGIWTCNANGQRTCVSNVQPQPEVCDNIDNDCDGVIDEGCACVNGDQRPCYGGPDGTEDVGVCVGGMQTCNLQGQWGACVGQIVPSDEVCDGEDNDCNGEEDDIAPDACQTNDPACPNGTRACEGNARVCKKPADCPIGGGGNDDNE